MRFLSSPFIPIEFHPLMLITVSLMIGVTAATTTSYIPLISFLLLLSAVSVTNTLEYSKCILLILLCISSCLVGNYLYTKQQINHSIASTKLTEHSYDCIAQLIDYKTTDQAQYQHILKLRLHKIKQQGYEQEWQPSGVDILVYCRKKTFLDIDDVVYLENCHFSKQKKNSSFNDFLLKEGITTTLFCNYLPSTILQHPAYSFRRFLHTWKHSVLARLCKKMTLKTASFFSSLFLGNRHTHKTHLKQMKNKFCIWGLAHFLARSGLHLVLFIFIWHLLLMCIPIPIRFKHVILLLISLLYALLSWSSLSFMRACIGFFIFYTACLLKKQIRSMHVVTLIALIQLLYNPIQLFFLDFQLSFGLTFALSWIHHTYTWHRLHTITNY